MTGQGGSVIKKRIWRPGNGPALPVHMSCICVCLVSLCFCTFYFYSVFCGNVPIVNEWRCYEFLESVMVYDELVYDSLPDVIHDFSEESMALAYVKVS